MRTAAKHVSCTADARDDPNPGPRCDGSAVTAYDERKLPARNMQNAVALPNEGVKINLVDTPDFTCSPTRPRRRCRRFEAPCAGERTNGVEALPSGCGDIPKRQHPRIVLVNQMDHPKAGGGGGLSALIDDLHERWAATVCSVQLPISDRRLPRRGRLSPWRPLLYACGDGHGKVSKEIPANLPRRQDLHEALVELVAKAKTS